MKARFIITVAATAFVLALTSQPAAATKLIDLTGGNNNSSVITEDQTLFQSLSEIRNQEQKLLSSQIELRQEQERTFPESQQIEELSAKLKQLNAELVVLEEAEEPDQDRIEQKKAEIDQTRFLLEQKSQTYHDSLELHLQKIDRLKKSISDTEAEIEKLHELAKSQALDFVLKISFFLGFIFVLLLSRFLSSKMIRRMSGKVPVQRERALLRLNKIVFNILIGISIVIGLFSQVVSFLPFLAILGTALAFAMRDIIASFIGWFVIGTDQGYKIGDLIQAGDLRGRVVEVHPLLTVLRQTGLRGDTGRIVTFPNKIIFEQNIQNFSKMYRFTYIMMNFLLERGSNVTDAKRELKEAVEEEMVKDIEEAQKNLPNLQGKFGIKADQILPQVFVEPDPRGILVRAKYFCRLDNRHMSRTKITENFLIRIEKFPDINLRFVEFGDKEE